MALPFKPPQGMKYAPREKHLTPDSLLPGDVIHIGDFWETVLSKKRVGKDSFNIATHREIGDSIQLHVMTMGQKYAVHRRLEWRTPQYVH